MGLLDRMNLAGDRDRWRSFVNAVMDLRVSYNVENFLTSLGPVSFSRRTLFHGVRYLVYVCSYHCLKDLKCRLRIGIVAVYSFSSGLLCGKLRTSFCEEYYISKTSFVIVVTNQYILPSSVKNSEH
jgi:hypothetical protein